MCGIAGFVDFNKQSSLQILENCTDVLQHRGPDDSGYELFSENNCQIGLGHRRLSVIDLSKAGKQPKQYKNYWITYNGEIYNFAELKETLVSLGHSFTSHNDTEVILHCYEEYGPAMVDKFIGMFAFVIYDAIKQTVFCGRDRAGAKPLYYYYYDGLFLFASELKAFHKHPQFKKSINLQAVHQYLQYGYIMAPLCIFNHSFKLEQGHYLTLDLQNKEIALTKYWDVYDHYNKPKVTISENEALEQTEKLIQSACKYRMVSDVPVGVFLSGGYDSSLVAAVLQKDSTQKIKTFSIGFTEKNYNEAHFAKEVAAYLGTDHTEQYCTASESQEIIPLIPDYYDEPNGDPSIIPTVLVSRLAKNKVTVALSADAGDETFGGYTKYITALQLKNQLSAIPFFARYILGTTLSVTPNFILSRISKKVSLLHRKQQYALALKTRNISINLITDRLINQYLSNSQLTKIINQNVNIPTNPIKSSPGLHKNVTDTDRQLAVDYKTYMADDILTKVDRASMSASLEGREPLLDHRIIEFVASLPGSFKINDGKTKYLLKQIAHKYVPQQLLDRPKMGFGVPVADWLRTSLKFYAEEYMNEKAFSVHNIFNFKEISKIISGFYSGNKNYEQIFWNLLIFQMWYKKWVS